MNLDGPLCTADQGMAETLLLLLLGGGNEGGEKKDRTGEGPCLMMSEDPTCRQQSLYTWNPGPPELFGVWWRLG